MKGSYRFPNANSPTWHEASAIDSEQTGASNDILVGATRTSGTAGTRGVVQAEAGQYAWFPSAQRLRISSSSASDTGVGTGAQAVRINGLDAEYHEITEDVVLSGTTVVLTTQLFLRVNEARVISSGSVRSNVGNIQAFGEVNTGSRIFLIPVETGRTMSTVYTVPAGKNMIVRGVYLSSGKNDEAELYYT